MEKKEKAGKPCDILHIVKLDDSRESAFLIQDMFPITEEYIQTLSCLIKCIYPILYLHLYSLDVLYNTTIKNNRHQRARRRDDEFVFGCGVIAAF